MAGEVAVEEKGSKGWVGAAAVYKKDEEIVGGGGQAGGGGTPSEP